MGSFQSSVQLQPVREPAALLNTGAGMIIRIPDPAGGASTYEHNSRLSTTPKPIASLIERSQSQVQQSCVAVVVRPGERNQALKGNIVYLKKTSRSSSLSS
ncbi:hypothetical protein GN244_ATG05669 [Phytophthora infestans]|uniref:Uncharacterized protein n=1 Tax=Phytophthora infestans TaxID=4787 RepID=A0A833SYS7_PHYIN|nr:hypothetical protein GN244_ATG05669 [Phytophthora infestans]KAF4138047.1 hypothetical protein GN958_ATG13000 [Phytophthora infestans]